MKSFWEWMEKNDYCKVRCEFTKQMLIGYMLEYLMDHNELIMEIPKEFFECGYKNVNTLHENLKQLINRAIKAEKVI